MHCQSHLDRGYSPTTLARRWFLKDCAVGLGAAAMGELLSAGALNAANTPAGPLTPRPGHFPAKAKNVIYLFMAGAPSHLELFDNKPELTKHDGQLPPAELLKGYRAAFINPNSALLGPKFKFAKHGQCGMELSEVLPHTAGVGCRTETNSSTEAGGCDRRPSTVVARCCTLASETTEPPVKTKA
jgi:hypothetical protein